MKNGFILLSDGFFGGAQKRFLTLFFYINKIHPGRFFFFVSNSLYQQIKFVFPNEDTSHFIIVSGKQKKPGGNGSNIGKEYRKTSKISIKGFKYLFINSYLYRYYIFLKNSFLYRKTFKVLEKHVNSLCIHSILGIYSGIFPLYFYFNKKRRPGIVFSNMDSWFSGITKTPLKDWYNKYSLFNYAHEKADYVDFLSPFILEGVRKRGIKIPDERARITACSFTDYTKCDVGLKEKFRVAFAGRLEKDKNPMLYLDAVSPLAEKYPNAEFHIIGEGRLTAAVEEKVKTRNLPNIIFHGFVPNPPEIFSETTVFVSIQTTNNYPSQSVLEAMACGTAVIATDVGDTRMFINENNGTLISLEKEQLQRAIENYILNPEVALEKGKNASQYVRKEFTIEKAADYYLGLFEMAAKKAQTGKK